MSQDHQLTFDWIFFAIVLPWPLLAVWDLLRTWGDRPRDP